MGENEQGGMLRVVVVVGLVALIAAAMIGSLTVLRGKMDSTSNNTTARVDKAIGDNSPAPTGQVLASDSLDIANRKAANLLQIAADNIDTNATTVDYGKWSGYHSGGQPQTMQFSARGGANNDASVTNPNAGGEPIGSPMFTIPKAATKVTLSVYVWSDGGCREVSAYIRNSSTHASEAVGGSWSPLSSGWQKVTSTFDVSNGVYNYGGESYDQIGMYVLVTGNVNKVSDPSIMFS